MESFNLYSIPAVIALLLKIGLLAATRISPIRTAESKIFLVLLFVLGLHNISEIMGFNYSGPKTGVISLTAGFLYYTFSIIAIAVVCHLMLIRLYITTNWHLPISNLIPWIYIPMVIVLYMLWFTDDLIRGFMASGFSYTRVPGSLYPWFEMYAMGYLSFAFVTLVVATIFSNSKYNRKKNVITLCGITPVLLMPVIVIGLQSYGIQAFSLPLWFALALSLFLIITAYAIYEHRLFDILVHLPWTKIYQRRTEFHNQIKAFISEVDKLPVFNIEEILSRLSKILNCGVAIVGIAKEPLISEYSESTLKLDDVPSSSFSEITDIVVTKEIEKTDSKIYLTLSSINCAAVIPFKPFEGKVQGWFLLSGKSDQPDTLPIDFAVVETLFDRMGSVFLEAIVKEREEVEQLRLALQQEKAKTLELSEELQTTKEALGAALGNTQVMVEGDWPNEKKKINQLLEKQAIEAALEELKGNMTATAQKLGMSRQSLYTKIQTYGIKRP